MVGITIFDKTHLSGRELVDDKFIREDFLNVFRNTTFLSDGGFSNKHDEKLTLGYDEEVLIYNELGLKPDNRHHRVMTVCDLAIIKRDLKGLQSNNISIGIEIKSDKDNVTRLDTQISSYKKYFDYVYLVVTSKNIDGAIKKAGRNVGIILYQSAGNYKIVQVAKQIKNKESGKYWSKLLWLEELNEELDLHNIEYKKNPLLKYKHQKINKFNSINATKVRSTLDYKKAKLRVFDLLYKRVEDELKGQQKTRHEWGRELLKEDNYIEIKSGK